MSSLPPFPAPYPDHTGNGNNPNMQFWNGTGTNPGPLLPYFVRPVNNWTQTDRRIHMVAPGATITPENDVRVMPSATVYKRGVWSSPVFDLAPMLGSTTVAQGGVVLGRGPDARLFLSVKFASLQGQTFNAYVCERAHAFDAAQVSATSIARSITGPIIGEVRRANATPTLTIAAPETGVRYWQVFLILDCLTNTALEDFVFTISATAY